jgi:hypothetical protein
MSDIDDVEKLRRLLADVLLRDYFAGQALAGLIAASDLPASSSFHQILAEQAYDIADWMMDIREAESD